MKLLALRRLNGGQTLSPFLVSAPRFFFDILPTAQAGGFPC